MITPRVAADGTAGDRSRRPHASVRHFTAVDHVSFRIERGEIFGFLGSNGCGKSTTMKMLTGLCRRPKARRNCSASRWGDDMEARRNVGFMTQAFSLYTELTVRQNLVLHARLFDLREERSRRASRSCSSLRPQTSPTRGRESAAWHSAAAVARRRGVARARVLILDEPTSGVDPVARDGFWELLIHLSRENR